MGRETYMRADLLIAELKAIGSKEKIGDYTRFFKTEPYLKFIKIWNLLK
jgi:hypothetical protein